LGVFEALGSLSEDVRSRTTPSTLLQMFLLFRYGVATLDRKSFGRIGSEGKHYLRISIATGLEDLEQAMERIEQALFDRTGFAAWLRSGAPLY
jgi:aspartate/methionine/tyrosine aminotransferase